MDLQTAIYEPTLRGNQQGEDRLDGNSVGLDQQITLPDEHSLSYETSLTLLSRTLAKRRYVISEERLWQTREISPEKIPFWKEVAYPKR